MLAQNSKLNFAQNVSKIKSCPKLMSNTNILVVEDESLVAKDIQNRLKKFGYTVPAIATSGEDAIQKVAEIYPDLVLMDIQLKGKLDGIEAAEKIYNDFNIPVIYLTANADESTLERAKITQPYGYIIKPFKEKELKTTIEITLTKHRMEKELKQSEQWLATVLRSIGDAVITSDRTGTVTFMNPAAEILTGWKQEEAFGQATTAIFNIIHEETHTTVENPITKALLQGATVTLPTQTVLIAKNGTEIPIDDSVAPIKDDKGNIMGTVLVFRDITERKQAEATRQKQIEQEKLVAQLEKLNSLKDDFLSTVSHELRTPISNMKMAIQMLKISAGSQERSQRYLEILQSECTRETDLINGLLDLQRLEAASYPTFIVESINLQECLPTIVEPFRVRTQQRNQNLQINLAPNFPTIVSDRASLERILAELLNNACKYTATGGEIVLSVERQEENIPADGLQRQFPQGKEPPHKANSFIPHTSTIFAVSNQAEIPEAELPRIFDKFFRLRSSDRWKQGGTGLGLALVKKLVEHLQGTIEVTSKEGWTTFTVQLIDLVVTND